MEVLKLITRMINTVSELFDEWCFRGLTLFVEDDGREGHSLSYVLDGVAFPSRADLTEGH